MKEPSKYLDDWDDEKDDDDDDEEEEVKLPETIPKFQRDALDGPFSALSSPFARRLMVAAAGPSKPIWYRLPTFKQFNIFKKLIKLLEDAQDDGNSIYFQDVLGYIQELAPTITAQEMKYVIDNASADETVDIGEFIFLLVNNPFYDVVLKAPRYQCYVLKNLFTPRQRLFYSNLAFYCLVQTEDDIERFYKGKSVQPNYILKYHLADQRVLGLGPDEMEESQETVRKANMFKDPRLRLPYNDPMPFVKSGIHEWYYLEYLDHSKKLPKALSRPKDQKKKVARTRYIHPYKVKRELGTPVVYETEEEKLVHQFLMCKLPRPDMRIPAKRLKEMRTRMTVDQSAYLELKKAEALKKYYDRLKLAIVTYSKMKLKGELEKGFPDMSTKLVFFDFFKSMMPLSVNEFFVLNPWTPTFGDRAKPRPKFERPAFGKKAE